MIGVSYHKSLRDLLWEFNEQPVSQATGLVEVGKVGVKGSQGARLFRVMAGGEVGIAFLARTTYNALRFCICEVLDMGRVSTKENKNIYQTTREALHLTREAAGELLETIPPERIEKIENERSLPHPDEVLTMADKYKQPGLCNYYCANQCPIGQEYVPEVKIKDLSQIVLEMLASLNSMNRRKERLIEITADGVISDDELEDFIHIREELERISIAVETLQLWSERMLATGAINAEQYEAYERRRTEQGRD